MKSLLAVAAAVALASCAAVPTTGLSAGPSGKALDTAVIRHPGVTFEFPGGVVQRTGAVFAPPKVIDCSRLSLAPDSYRAAIDAGAQVVRIRTPGNVTLTSTDSEGRESRRSVAIQQSYGGVLAFCRVSERATGPDSRSYDIRGLDDYFVKGKDGLISVVGAVVSADPRAPTFAEILMASQTGQTLTQTATEGYSWMLWMSDRGSTFENYAAQRAAQAAPAPAAPAATPPAAATKQ